MESALVNLQRAERCLTMARQQIATDVQEAGFWVDAAAVENDIARTKAMFRLSMDETRPTPAHLVLVDDPTD